MRGTSILALLLLASYSAAAVTAPTKQRPPASLDAMVTPMRKPGTSGGRFSIVVTSDPRTFNPILASESNSTDICERLYCALADLDRVTQTYVPALARHWDVSADRRTWTWHLRRGARFSDGHPIRAEDVVFSFAVANDTTLHPPIQDALQVHGAPIQVSAPDDSTVVTRIVRPYGLMVATVAALRILPKHVLDDPWRSGRFASSYGVGTPPESLVTSGPWHVQQFSSHEKTVLARNPYWFGVDARRQRLPYLDELVFVVVPDQNTAALKFYAGEVDALDNVRPEDFATFESKQTEGDFTLHTLGASLTSNFFWFNLNTVKVVNRGKAVGAPAVDAVPYKWFSNPEFRRAVSIAIDRSSIIRAVFFGHGVKNWSVITSGNRVFHVDPGNVPDYDADGARALLTRLGFMDRNGDGVIEDDAGHPIEFVLKTNANSNLRIQMANFVRDDLRQVGIRCTVTPVDFNTMMANIQNDLDYQAMLGGLGTTVPPDPALGANFYVSSGATHFWNARQIHPESPAEARVDSLFDRLVTAEDISVRKQIAAAVDRIILDQCWIVWLPIPEVKAAVRNRFGNLQPAAIRPRVLWNAETLFVRGSTAKR